MFVNRSDKKQTKIYQRKIRKLFVKDCGGWTTHDKFVTRNSNVTTYGVPPRRTSQNFGSRVYSTRTEVHPRTFSAGTLFSDLQSSNNPSLGSFVVIPWPLHTTSSPSSFGYVQWRHSGPRVRTTPRDSVSISISWVEVLQNGPPHSLTPIYRCLGTGVTQLPTRDTTI